MPMINNHLLAIARNSGCNIFVESGTCKGSSFLKAIYSNIFQFLYSVEIEDGLYNKLKTKIPNSDRHAIFHGSSYKVFQSEIFPRIKPEDNVFFWLDGHYSEGPTGGAEFECPVIRELEIIKNHCPACNMVIAVDDSDDFGRKDPGVAGHNWPEREDVIKAGLAIKDNIHIIDYTGAGDLPKINRGILLFSTGKPGANASIHFQRLRLNLQESILNAHYFLYGLKKRFLKFAAKQA